MVNPTFGGTLIVQVILASSSVDFPTSLDDRVGILSDTSDHGWSGKSTHVGRADVSFFGVEQSFRL